MDKRYEYYIRGISKKIHPTIVTKYKQHAVSLVNKARISMEKRKNFGRTLEEI